MIYKRLITILLIFISIETICFSENSILDKDKNILDINKQFINALTSKNPETRFEGAEAIREQYEQLVDELIKLVTVRLKSIPLQEPDNSEYIQYYSKYLAIRLLGDLHTNKAVSVLLDNLEYQNTIIALSSPSYDIAGLYPSAEALAKIGSPAVIPTIKKLGKFNKNEVGHKICCWILRDILGAKLAKASVQITIDETLNTEVKRNLNDAIPILNTYIEEDANSFKP